jgi:hypothetical protein
MFVQLQRIRRLLLLGAVDEAARMHHSLASRRAPPRTRSERWNRDVHGPCCSARNTLRARRASSRSAPRSRVQSNG